MFILAHVRFLAENARQVQAVLPGALDCVFVRGIGVAQRFPLVIPHSARILKRTMEHGYTGLSNPPQTIPDIISPELLQVLRDHGVIRAELFGSFAAGTAGPESDLDLLVAFDRPVTLFQRLDLAEELSRQCGRRVDVLTAIDPAFLPYIKPTLVALPL